MRRAALAACLVVLATFAGCAAPARPPSRTLALGHAPGFSNPALHVTVHGVPAWLLVDTGAGVHTLAAWYVQAAGLSVSAAPGMSVKDSSGREVPIHRVQNVRATLEGGGTLRISQAIVADFPPRFAKNRVAGLVSPQLLAAARGGAAALDLRLPAPELRFEPFRAAVARLRARRLPPGAAEVCRTPGTLLYALRTRVGKGTASLGLDTGAEDTTIDRGSAAARGLAGLRPSGFFTGVTGVREPRFRSPAVAVDFGAGVRSVALDVGHAGSSCGTDGLLGLDAVQGCAFVLSDRALAVACSPR